MQPNPSDLPLACVLDANVAIKLFINQPDSDLARALFASRLARPAAQYHVPDFFYAECTNVLARYVRLAEYPARTAHQNMARLMMQGLRIMPTVELLPAALDIAIVCGISGYDACYVALSKRTGTPLITADEKLVKAMADHPYQIRALASLR